MENFGIFCLFVGMIAVLILLSHGIFWIMGEAINHKAEGAAGIISILLIFFLIDFVLIYKFFHRGLWVALRS